MDARPETAGCDRDRTARIGEPDADEVGQGWKAGNGPGLTRKGRPGRSGEDRGPEKAESGREALASIVRLQSGIPAVAWFAGLAAEQPAGGRSPRDADRQATKPSPEHVARAITTSR